MIGAVLGVVVGFLLTFPFMLAHIDIEYAVHTLFPSLPRDPSGLEMLLSSIVFYVVWLGVLMLIAKRTGRLSATVLFLVVLPMPPMIFEQYLVHSPLMSGDVH
jgi:hypothetical protein